MNALGKSQAEAPSFEKALQLVEKGHLTVAFFSYYYPASVKMPK